MGAGVAVAWAGQGALPRARSVGSWWPEWWWARSSVRAVLTGLGRQLTGDERVDLAARLP